jgi:Secretion system C-terminal sorting domain
MKKNLSLLTFLLFAKITFAQISITQSDMPSANDTIRYSTAAAIGVNFDPKQTGANQTWDFSKLTTLNIGLFEYKNSLTTPYLFYFINKIGLKAPDIGANTISLTDVYQFYTKNNNVFKTEGQGYSYNKVPLANNYVDDDEIYQFPLNFKDRDSSTFYFDYKLADLTQFVNYAQNGYRINEADAWGSITTPYKKYDNVLRVKTKVVTYDSIKISGFPIVTNRTTIEYKWLSKTEKIPVLEISGTEVLGNFTPTTIRFRGVEKKISSSQDIDNQTNIAISPNPVSDVLTFKSDIDFSDYQIVNTLGEVVQRGNINDGENQISVRELTMGTYFIAFSYKNKSDFKIVKISKL